MSAKKVQRLPREFLLDDRGPGELMPSGITGGALTPQQAMGLIIEANQMRLTMELMRHLEEMMSGYGLGGGARAVLFVCPWCGRNRRVLVPLRGPYEFFLECKTERNWIGNPRQIRVEVGEGTGEVLISRK